MIIATLGVTQIMAWGVVLLPACGYRAPGGGRYRLAAGLGGRRPVARAARRRLDLAARWLVYRTARWPKCACVQCHLNRAWPDRSGGSAERCHLYRRLAGDRARHGRRLYDAAFATLGRLYGHGARSAITTLTLFGGFASMICWPISAFLMSEVGWRGACLAYAAVQLLIALPLYLVILPRENPQPPVKSVSKDTTASVPSSR